MIDIKELTIGSHLLLCEIRVEVITVDGLNNLIGLKGYSTFQYGKEFSVGNEPQNLDPIPITEELLKELGFEKNNGIGGYDYKKDFDKCAVFVTLIGEWCRFETWDEKSMRNFGNILCQHLHQAESFVYSTIKKELL